MPRFDSDEMAKFRNRLVHLYWEVDDAQLWAFLNSNGSPFPSFGPEAFIDPVDFSRVE